MKPEQERLKKLITDCTRAVVFTGAGISTESGIPDFRGPGGLWTRYKPIQFQEFVSSEEARQRSWQAWFEHGQSILDAQPNYGHEVVARLASRGKVAAVITQNIDNLHQESGLPEEQVIELHGNASYAKCLQCNSRFDLAVIEQTFKREGHVEPCANCGGIVKLATISFGQQMPEEPMRRAQEETMACDLFLVLGSSLTVYPAAAFPAVAQGNGARLVIINQQPTDLDPVADLVIRAGIGETVLGVE